MNAQVISHDLVAVSAQLDALQKQVSYLVERQKKQEELFAELTPILRIVMAEGTSRLDALEKKGYFAFGREVMSLGERVIEGFSPEDVRRLGDAIVTILGTVRALTQPEVLAVAGEAAAAMGRADDVEPLGLFGMVRATRDNDVQKGMALMMEVMRHVGRAAEAASKGGSPKAPSQAPSPMEQKRERLAAVTGARRKALGTERPAVKPPVAACAVPKAPQEAVTQIDGIGFSADGHLADPSAWTRDLALTLAAAQGVTLAEPHWAVLERARADFTETGVSPNIRRITQVAGVSTKDLYTLFPKAPARTIAKIAGIPKPAGCI